VGRRAASANVVLSACLFRQTRPEHWPESTERVEKPQDDEPANAVPGNWLEGESKAQVGAQVPSEGKLESRWHEPVEIIFSSVVLAFGFALIVLFTRNLLRDGQHWRAMYLRLTVLTVVVTAGLFVITAGYSQDQVSPMMGLLGTLVGYLLGRETNQTPSVEGAGSAKG